MKIGNWNITENAIEWQGEAEAEGLNRFVIDREALTDLINIDGKQMYKWIVLATDEEWLSVDDLYDLNFAFVYAAGETSQDFDYQILDKTIEYQFEILEEEEENDPE